MTQEQHPVIYHSKPIRETGVTPERVDIITWYIERLADFGEVTVERVNATDGQAWKAELEGTEVKRIVGAFFTVEGAHVTRHNPDETVMAAWTQPGIFQSEVEMVMPTPDGEQRVMTSGFVGVLRDEANNVLLTLAPEPFARTPKRLLFRTPFQTSAAKFLALLDGDRAKDPNLYDVLVDIGGSTDIRGMFASERVDAFPLPYGDANRMDATNYGFAVSVSDPDLRERLKNDDKNRWCSPADVREIMRAGLLNGHTASAIFASTSLVK